MRTFFPLGLIILFFVGCTRQVHINEETNYRSKSPNIYKIVSNYKKVAKEVANCFTKDSSKIELYLQLDKTDATTRVASFDSVMQPEYNGYNLIRNKQGKIIFISEYPVTDSDEYDMIYESYFDPNGNLLAFIRKCIFNNGGCAKIVNEKSDYYYDEKHKLVLKTYELTDENKKPLKYINCIFNFRFEYKIYKTTKEYLKARQFVLSDKVPAV